MKIPYFHIDAFASEVGHGNPAGICALDGWIDDKIMQTIATENNLSEMAFLVKNDSIYEIRWFTPTSEINLSDYHSISADTTMHRYL